MTFGSIGASLCGPQRLVADSVKLGKPIIAVALNYRLNIFGLGDGRHTNLAWKDQTVAIKWARKHIACSRLPSAAPASQSANKLLEYTPRWLGSSPNHRCPLSIHHKRSLSVNQLQVRQGDMWHIWHFSGHSTYDVRVLPAYLWQNQGAEALYERNR